MEDASAPVASNDAETELDAQVQDAESALPRDDGGPLGDPTGVLAVPALTFLRSIGVCTHVGQGIDNPEKSAQAMAYAGIRNFRDDGRPGAVPGWIKMHQIAGVRGSILTDHNVQSTLDMGKKLHAVGALLAIEGANEPNNFPVTYNGKQSSTSTTFRPVAELQRDLYTAVKADSALKDTPVFHSSEAGGSEPDNVGLQFLTIPPDAGTLMPAGTKYADYANVHNYVCGHSSKLVDNVAWQASDPTLNGDWDSLYVEYGLTWGGQFTGYSNDELLTLPRVSTETGWKTSGGSGVLTLAQQGKVFLDLYLSAFKRGFAYTFIYMLRDDPMQGSWGLFNGDYSAKLSGEYLHNFTTVLADSSERMPGMLDYTLTTSSPTVHDLLLQKSDGAFELVVWGERFSGGSDEVTLNFAVERPQLHVFDPLIGTAPLMAMQAARTVQLTVTDHPLVVELPR